MITLIVFGALGALGAVVIGGTAWLLSDGREPDGGEDVPVAAPRYVPVRATAGRPPAEITDLPCRRES